MMPGEVRLLEAAGFEDCHGEGVAHGEHGGRAGGRGEIEWTGFARHFHVQNDIAVAGERGMRRAGEGDDASGEAFQVREQVDEFV